MPIDVISLWVSQTVSIVSMLTQTDCSPISRGIASVLSQLTVTGELFVMLTDGKETKHGEGIDSRLEVFFARKILSEI